jgi:hypothetical protein
MGRAAKTQTMDSIMPSWTETELDEQDLVSTAIELTAWIKHPVGQYYIDLAGNLVAEAA